MHVAIPLYMDTIADFFGRHERTWGRLVANHGLILALAALPPPFRLSILVPTRRDVGTLRSTLLAAVTNPIDVVPLGELGDFLAANPIDVLHVADPNLWIGAHIRNQVAPSPFVITGMTHSLANEHFLNWALLNSANGVHAGDCLVCTTPTAEAVIQRAMARLGGEQPGFSAPATTVIPLGAAVDTFRNAQPLPRAGLGLTDDDFVVLSFARFNPMFKMDLQPLINLVDMLAPRLKRPLRLIFAGAGDNGAYARFLQERVRDRGLTSYVRFVLDASDSDKAGLFRAADVFLSLSDNIQETFGLTLVEAMAAGLPVVASDWDGYQSLVQDGTTGYLVPTRMLPAASGWGGVLPVQADSLVHMLLAQTTAVDLDVAADRLARLAGDRSLAQRMGAAGMASAAALSWDRIAGRYVELWERLAGAAAASPAATPASRRSSALDFLGDFAGYATASLAPTDRFVTSGLGRKLLGGQVHVNLYEHLDEMLDMRLMVRLLRVLERQQSFTEVVASFRGPPARSAAELARNVLWLYKYGYLSAAGPG